MSSKFPFTNPKINGLLFFRDRQRKYWDTKQPGLGLVVGRETKTFIVSAQHKERGTIRVSLGRFPKITVDQAREFAKEKIGEIVRGVDPINANRKAKRDAEDRKQSERTVKQLADAFLEARTLKPKTKYQYARLFAEEGPLKPLLGMEAVAVAREDVLKWFIRLRDKSPYYATQAARVLGAVFNAADIPNPVRILKQQQAWPDKTRRDTYIRETDLPKFFKAAGGHSHQKGADRGEGWVAAEIAHANHAGTPQ